MAEEEAVSSHARGRRPRECHLFFFVPPSVCDWCCACTLIAAGWPSWGVLLVRSLDLDLSGRSVQSVRILRSIVDYGCPD